MDITKAIIPVAGLGTRFLPLSKVLPKEIWPLVDKPLIQYAVQEAKLAGVKEIIFVVNSNKKVLQDYFRKSQKLEKILEERKQHSLLEELQKLEKLSQDISFAYVSDRPLGDGHALLQARRLVGEESPCFVLFPDDVIESTFPCLLQLAQIFKTSHRPVIGLARVPKEKISAYGVVQEERIARRLSKIKKIIEKPSPSEIPSNLAIVGRSIVTQEVFESLKKARFNKKGEVVLSEVFGRMAEEGSMIYGYEFEGKWLQCGNKKSWLQAHLYLSFKHAEFGPELKSFLKAEKLV